MEASDDLSSRGLSRLPAQPLLAGLALELIEEFSDTSKPDEVLRRVLLRALMSTEADRGAVFWVEGDEIVVADFFDSQGSSLPRGTRMPLLEQAVTRRALAGARPARGGQMYLEGALAPVRALFGDIRHSLVAPIEIDGQLVALIGLTRRRAEPFTPEHEAVMELIGKASASAVRAARLTESLEMTIDELREQVERAGGLERVKSDIIQLASHELRSPVTVLRGYVSLIQEGTFGEVTESVRAVLPILEAKTAEMNALIDGMLMAARIEDSEEVMVREAADLRELVRGCVEGMAGTATARHRMRLELPETPVPVRVDVDRLSLAVRNVLHNAIKYSPGGGEVVCVVAVDDGQATIHISDEGLGISSEDQDRLFTRFGRVLTGANSHIRGVGLGLYVSREVLRRHGGEVVASVRRPKGSTFTLTIPLDR